MSRMAPRSNYSLAGAVCLSGCPSAGHTGRGLEAFKPYPKTPELDLSPGGRHVAHGAAQQLLAGGRRVPERLSATGYAAARDVASK